LTVDTTKIEQAGVEATLSIDEMGRVIAWHLRDYQTATNALPAPANLLITVYATMNYHRQTHIALRMLGDEELSLVQQALTAMAQLELPAIDVVASRR
jgi:hypothetical protein